eukprot:TRINITY_DN30811_c0_g1_i2.p1 TRINITY_DN30811_c0_g1~~TRINITY_DN30811_c0_g1_i2.p1  ORF type:complete len:938 (+),score=209.60 TRINITY_DN30811_c0_g1_i2:116-2929(+)
MLRVPGLCPEGLRAASHAVIDAAVPWQSAATPFPGMHAPPQAASAPSKAAAEIRRTSLDHDKPLLVVGIVCKAAGGSLSAAELWSQLETQQQSSYLAEELGLSADSLFSKSGVRFAYRERDNVLALLLDSTVAPGSQVWKHLSEQQEAENNRAYPGCEDAAFLAHLGEAEVLETMTLLLLFNVCNVLLWIAPGAAPRVDTDSLNVFGRLHELQFHPEVAPALSAGWARGRSGSGPPLLLLLHPELRVADVVSGGGPVPRQHLETVEKVLDSRWKSSLKRYASNEKSGQPGLFRLQRPCAAAVPGPFARLAAEEVFKLASSLDEIDPLAEVDVVLSVAHAPWPIDRLRSRLADLIAGCGTRDGAARGATITAWREGAVAMSEQLYNVLSASRKLPVELSQIVFEGQNGYHDEDNIKLHLGGERERKLASDVVAPLRRWAFAELLFSFCTSQRGYEEGHRGYKAATHSLGPMSEETYEQHFKAALRLLHRRSSAPLHEAAAAALARRCDGHYAAKRLCPQRSIYGRACPLVSGHDDDHKSVLRPVVVCLCGKSQTTKQDSFGLPATPEEGLPPASACCRYASFVPFLPAECDVLVEPPVLPVSPRAHALAARAARATGKGAGSLLPPALPDAHGFVAVVAEPSEKCDPHQAFRLAGFSSESSGGNAAAAPSGTSTAPPGALQHMSKWRLPAAGFMGGCGLGDVSTARHVYVGFEYVCPQGQRFFLPPSKSSGLIACKSSDAKEKRKEKHRRSERSGHETGGPPSSPPKGPQRELPGLFDEGAFETVPLTPYRLFVPVPPQCVRHGKKDAATNAAATNGSASRQPTDDGLGMAQLCRIWVKTPSAEKSGELIVASPRIRVVDPEAEKGVDGTQPEFTCSGGKVVLPHGRLVQLVLPQTFHRPDGSPVQLPVAPRQRLGSKGSEMERCRLLPYVFWVSKPS